MLLDKDMYFSDIQISNYKGYRNSVKLKLTKGVNIVVGRNNAGKTALLEALSLKFEANPHRTLETVPALSRIPTPVSSVTFTLTFTRDELIDLLIAGQGSAEFHLALPALRSPVAKKLKLKEHNDVTAKEFGEWFFSHDSYTFRIQREAFGGLDHANWYMFDDSYQSPHFDRASENDGASGHYGKFRIDPIAREFSFLGHLRVSGSGKHYDDFVLRTGRFFNRYIYRFRAERIPSAPCQLGTERTLASDASNLAETLTMLHGNLEQFGEYNRLVREILPDIFQVGTRRLNDNLGEVVVWSDEKATARDDLAFNLTESGSGVGQVLAILYVVLTAREPQVIILDEPQGFLHPGAVRKLVGVLRDYTKDRHQLVIATHSPTVITSADPSSVTMIRQAGAESFFESIDIKDAARQRAYLGAVGARLSDVFGYDRILWVEGETEEICFPLILRELTDQPLMGTAILRVQHTGDFNRKDSRNVIAIYERLSQVEGGLVPLMVGFIFDREVRSATEQDDLKRQGHGRIHFTRKRLFENYLLNPIGIAAVVNNIKDFSKRTITKRRVSKWIDEHKSDPKYYKPLKRRIGDEEDWSHNVNGAVFLKDLFASLSSGLVVYDKTEHSPMLTDWTLKNVPSDLKEISELIVNAITIVEPSPI